MPPSYSRSTGFDPERAADELAREHDALANMQGNDSRRIDSLVSDVGEIKGDLRAVKGDMQRVGSGIEQLQESMAVLGRHAVLMETTTAEIKEIHKDHSDLEGRVRCIELHMPALQEARSDYRKGVLAVLAVVGAAILFLVIRR